jgi:hypothetical protein
VLGSHAYDGRFRLEPVEELDLHLLGAVHHMEISKNYPRINDHDAASDSFGLVAVLALLACAATDPHDRTLHCGIGLGRVRLHRHVLEGVQHSRIDVLLGELRLHRREGGMNGDKDQREQRAADQEQRTLVAGEPAAPGGANRRSRRRRRVLSRCCAQGRQTSHLRSGRRAACALARRPAIQRHLLHP